MGRRDELIIRFDSILMSTINLLVMIKPTNRTNDRRNEQLKINHGDTCFIIGNGPSLNHEDLQLISDKDSINVNFFYNGSFDFKGTYLLLVDPGFCDERGVQYLKKCSKINETLRVLTCKKNYDYFVKNQAFPVDKLFCINTNLKQHSYYIKTDISKIMTGSLNVVPVAIEAAIGMGYKKIYLLGCDFSFYGSKSVGKHFYDNKDAQICESYNTVGNLIRCALVQQHHFAINNYCTSNGIVIQNLTPDSLIMAYESNEIRNIVTHLQSGNTSQHLVEQP